MEDKELTFWEHLDVLRWALVRIVVVWFILAIGFFIAMPSLFDTVILGPCHNNFIFYQFLRSMGEALNLTGDFFTQEFDIKLQNINLAAPFFVHLSTSFVLSLVVLAPYILWEIWLFIRPALYVNESRGVKKALLLGSVMFYIGVAVGYFVIYPMTLRFLSTYNLSPDIEILISLNSYIDNFMTLVLCMGLAFELPLVTWILSLLGIITRDTLREYRRHAFVVIVIVSAIITPTGDPFTLMAVTLPLYALYELSILMVKDKKDDDDDDDDDKPTSGNNGGSNKPTGGAPAQKAIEKKPDSPQDGGDAKALPATDDKTKEAQPKKEDKPISDVLREQREAAQRAKNEASNKALQERIDAAAKSAAATGAAAGVAAEASAEGAAPALTANTEPTVKESLAAAAEATAKKVKKEPRMVIIDDQIFFEEYPDEDIPAPQDAPAEKQAAQPMETTAPEEPSASAESAETSAPASETSASSAPAEQAAPVEEPVASAESAEPAESVAPASEPAAPVAPVEEPAAPAAPVESAEPSAPVEEPAASTETVEPAQPVEHTESSAAPSESTASAEPTAPTEPTKPSKPRIDFGGIKYDPNRFKQQ